MTSITRKQREAIKAVFDRNPLYHDNITGQHPMMTTGASVIATSNGWSYDQNEDGVWRWWHEEYGPEYADAADVVDMYGLATPISYREFRKKYVTPGYDCLMVAWNNMWLGVEKDGYTHS